MTLPTMNPGDRVRITVEGEVITQNCYTWSLRIDGQIGDYGLLTLTKSELTAPTARVEVLPPPIEVGDVVRFKGCPAPVKVLAIAGHEAWLDVLHMQRPIHNLCDLTLVSKAYKAGGRV